MAFTELNRQLPAELAPLIKAVTTELKRPERQRKPKGSPIVFKDSSGLPQYSHWYVVWDRFAGFGDEIRTDVVFNAIKEAFGPKEALKTVTAMGLTREEAVNMGFKVE